MVKAVIVQLLILLIPSFLLLRRQATFLYWINVFIISWFFYICYIYIPWANYGSAYLKYLYLIILFLILIISFRIRQRNTHTNASTYSKVAYFIVSTLLTVFLLNITIQHIKANYEKSEEINLYFPFKNGSYYIKSGGSNKWLNYHRSLDTIYHKAFDIIKINKYGYSGNSVFKPASRKEDLYIYSDSVFSPINGKIVDIINSEKDHHIGNQNDFKDLQANGIAIESNGYIIELIHFKQNSIHLNVGDSIKPGEFIGLIGNSGQSGQPHLHIHALNMELEPVNILFNGKSYQYNDIITVN